MSWLARLVLLVLCVGSAAAWAGDHGRGGGARPGPSPGAGRSRGWVGACRGNECGTGPGWQGGVIVGGFLGAAGGAYVGGASLGGGSTYYGSTSHSSLLVPGRYARGSVVVVTPAYPYFPYLGYGYPYGSSAYGFNNPPSPPYPPEQPLDQQEPMPEAVEQPPMAPQIYLVPVPTPAPAPPVAPAPAVQPQATQAPQAAPIVPAAPSVQSLQSARPATRGPDVFHWVDENGIENYSTSVPPAARGKAKKVTAGPSAASPTVDPH